MSDSVASACPTDKEAAMLLDAFARVVVAEGIDEVAKGWTLLLPLVSRLVWIDWRTTDCQQRALD